MMLIATSLKGTLTLIIELMHHMSFLLSPLKHQTRKLCYMLQNKHALLKSVSDECLRHVASQIDLKADVSTTLVTELSPTTDYSLTVHAVYPSRIGDSATITARTSAWTHSEANAPR